MLILFRALSRWPLWFLHGVGAVLGWLTYWASPSYRRRFNDNVRHAGVAPSAARPAIAAAGRMVAELPFLWLRPAGEPIRPSLNWEGDALITDALRAGHGLVLLTPHMGSFEVAAQAIAQRFAAEFGPITVLYRPARKAALRAVMDESRARPGVATAPASLAGVRLMIRALRRGEAVGLLPDQVPPEGMGVWVPFFGKPAYTMTLAARLVQQTGAVPLLIWGERLPRGAGYTVRVSELGETLPTPDAPQADAGPPQGGLTPAVVGGHHQAESAAIINRAMERLIRQCPAQYLWGYHRYKTPRSGD
ncbi:MAG: lysophospholipid acyltransferase family protein [Burkholderiales bacterium]